MPRKILILHIGTHKTGTTSFQGSLLRNRRQLAGQDLVPLLEQRMRDGARTGTKEANLVRKAHLFVRPELRTLARIRKVVPDLSDQQCANRRARLAERLRTMPARRVLFSAEALSFLRTSEEKRYLCEFLDQTEREVCTLVVFREDAAWRASWENQLHRRAEIYEEIQRQPEEKRINAEWYYDKSAIRDFWAPFHLKELSYEEHENIVDTLYHEIGIATEKLNTDIRANTRKPVTLPA